MNTIDSCDLKVTETIKLTKHKTNGRSWIQPVLIHLWNTSLHGDRQVQEELSILEAGLSHPKKSFNFLGSETLSHKLSQRKAIMIKIIEHVVHTIPKCFVR